MITRIGGFWKTQLTASPSVNRLVSPGQRLEISIANMKSGDQGTPVNVQSLVLPIHSYSYNTFNTFS